jgi:seryl-tRNA synthetase
MTIDYSIIADAVKFYKALGYEEIDVPWLVSTDAIYGTLPIGAQPMSVSGSRDFGHLVGSAEQSFMQMMLDGTLSEGSWLAVTPCFRDEPEITASQRLSFMKVELIQYFSPNNLSFATPADLLTLMDHARQFMERYLPITTVRTNRLTMEDNVPDMQKTYDLVYRSADFEVQIEFGSFGYREWRGHRWIFGTGVAEPRMSQAVFEDQQGIPEAVYD